MSGHRFIVFVTGLAAMLSAATPSAPANDSVSSQLPVPICVPPTQSPPQSSNAPNSTPVSDATAPERFRNGHVCVRVQFETQDDVQRICIAGGAITPPPGYSITACYLRDPVVGLKIVMPNPCLYPDGDPYSHLMCHEVAHVNGWPVTHGD